MRHLILAEKKKEKKCKLYDGTYFQLLPLLRLSQESLYCVQTKGFALNNDLLIRSNKKMSTISKSMHQSATWGIALNSIIFLNKRPHFTRRFWRTMLSQFYLYQIHRLTHTHIHTNRHTHTHTHTHIRTPNPWPPSKVRENFPRWKSWILRRECVSVLMENIHKDKWFKSQNIHQ